MTTEKPAQSDFPIQPLLATRWSPRAFAQTPVEAAQVQILLEAARWAASSVNQQPWRFVVGMHGDDYFNRIRDSLHPSNAVWAGNAPTLFLVVARVQHGERRLSHACFDCGLAVGNLSVQAEALGLRVHPMAGFSSPQIRAEFAIPDEFEPVVVLAVGYPSADLSNLPPYLQEREQQPRTRYPQQDLVFNGSW